MIPAFLAALATPLAAPQVAAAPTPPPVSANSEAPRLAAARRMIALFNLDDTLDRIYVQLSPVMAKAVIGILADDERAKPAMTTIMSRENGSERFVAIMSQELMTEMRSHYPELKERAAKQYAAAFTLDELTALTAFYSSGPGAKALRLMPELQRQMALEGQEIGRTAGSEAGKRAFERAAREILDIKPKPKA